MKYTIFNITRQTSEDAFQTVHSTSFKVLLQEEAFNDIEDYTIPGHSDEKDLIEYVEQAYYVSDEDEVVVDDTIIRIQLTITHAGSPANEENELQVAADLKAYIDGLRERIKQEATGRTHAGFGCFVDGGPVMPCSLSFSTRG